MPLTAISMLILAAASIAAASPWPDLSRMPTTGDRTGRADAAVLVGIEDYARLRDVPGARESIDHWTVWLARGRGVPISRIHRLIDHQATPEKMRSAMSAAAEQVGAGGTLWFVYVGHAVPGPGGLDSVFVGPDARRTAAGIHAESVGRSELWERSQAVRSVWVVDASLNGRRANGNPLVAGLPQPRPEIPSLIGQSLFSWADGRPDGPGLPGAPASTLSYLMLGAMRGWADADDDAVVDGAEAVSYLADALWAAGVRQKVSLVGPSVPLSEGASEQGPDLVAELMDPLTGVDPDGALVEASLDRSLPEQAGWAAAA
jgi:hypothetical protein